MKFPKINFYLDIRRKILYFIKDFTFNQKFLKMDIRPFQFIKKILKKY